jgi:hypothetical protein
MLPSMVPLTERNREPIANLRSNTLVASVIDVSRFYLAIATNVLAVETARDALAPAQPLQEAGG